MRRIFLTPMMGLLEADAEKLQFTGVFNVSCSWAIVWTGTANELWVIKRSFVDSSQESKAGPTT
jgi:hypothetical protein